MNLSYIIAVVSVICAVVKGDDSLDWSEWSEPSECSRTCDGGIAFRLRNCFNPKGCLGGNIKYSICNTNNCERTTDAWEAQRVVLCSQFNTNATGYTWTPIMQPSDPCALWCRGSSTTGASAPEVMTKLESKVVDGSRCDRTTSNMCVQGKCFTIGCDQVFGSPMVKDECSRCGGEGRDTDLLTGHNCNYSPKELINIPNSFFAWKRGSFGKCSVDCGTGKQSTDVHCINTKNGQQIDDSLCASFNMPPPKSRVCYRKVCAFNWRVGDWMSCTKTCGNGTKRRDIFCIIGVSMKKAAAKEMQIHVAEEFCKYKTKPASVMSCVGDKCETTYAIPSRNDFISVASKSNEISAPNIQIPVFILPKGRYSDPMTQSYEQREVDKFYIKLGEWAPCSRQCGEGVRERTATCHITNSTGYETELKMRFCEKVTQPKLFEICTGRCIIRPRYGYEWRYRMHSKCNSTCGYGIKYAIFECVDLNRERPVLKSFCSSNRKPFRPAITCEWEKRLCTPRWIFPKSDRFSDCSKSCGGGNQNRIVQCQQITPMQNNILKVESVDHSECVNAMPPATRVCNNHNCPAYWKPDQYGPCSVTCGRGKQMRKVHCVQYDVAMDQLLRKNEDACSFREPNAVKKCSAGPCPTRAPRPKRYIFQDKNTTFFQILKQRRVLLLVGGRASLLYTTTITVKCLCKNFPKRDIIWKHKGEVIGKRIKNRVKANKGYLLIKSGGIANIGRYECFAGNLTAGIDIDYHGTYLSDPMVWERKKQIRANYDFENNLKRQLAKKEEFRINRLKKKGKNIKKRKLAHKVFTLTSIKRLNKGLRDVPFTYYTGNWTTCSKSCGHGGVIYRDVICEVVFSKYVIQVPIKHCRNKIAGYAPLESEDCYLAACPSWYVGKWNNHCSVFHCQRHKYGSYSRRLYCRGSGDEHFSNSMCPRESKPSTRMECPHDACFVTWSISKWTDCSPSCQWRSNVRSTKTRTISCIWNSSRKPAGVLCKDLTMPITIKYCEVPTCNNYSCIDRIGKPRNGFTKQCSIYYRHRSACRNSKVNKQCCRTCSMVHLMKKKQRQRARQRYIRQ